MVRFFIFLSLFFSGCNLKPSYSRPEMDLGERYRFSLENAKEYANLSWWKELQDPKLDELIETALKNNYDLKIATDRILEFYARYKEVFSQFFPEINGVGSVDRRKPSESINFLPRNPTVPKINNLYELFARASYELDFWGKIRNASDAAKSLYLGQVYARQNVVLTLVTSLASAYILLKQSIDQLEISKRTYQTRLASWDIARLRFEVGITSKLEVEQAESEALVAEVQIKNFEIFLGKQEDLIGVLIGQAPNAVDAGKALTDLKLPCSIPEGLPSDLLENRPDILQAEQKILAANAEVGVARAAFFPSITLTGAFGQTSTAIKTFFKNAANFWNLGMQAFEPIFTGWRLTYELRENEAVLLEAIHGYQQTILVALQEVDDALLEHEKAREKLKIQRQRVISLAEYLRLAKLRYFNGQNDYLTVLDAEKSLFAAQLVEVETYGDLYLSLFSLYKALGQGWDIPEEQEENAHF